VKALVLAPRRRAARHPRHQQHAPAAGGCTGICDGAPETCVSNGQRTACGQLYQTGGDVGPLRVESPTAAPSVSNTEGPCGLSVSAQPLATINGADYGSDRRRARRLRSFVVLDVDAASSSIAIIVNGTANAETATLFLQRPAGPGVDTGIAASVTTATRDAWSAARQADVTAGFVVTYKTGVMPSRWKKRVDARRRCPPGAVDRLFLRCGVPDARSRADLDGGERERVDRSDRREFHARGETDRCDLPPRRNVTGLESAAVRRARRVLTVGASPTSTCNRAGQYDVW
jgi:hypothetical protein